MTPKNCWASGVWARGITNIVKACLMTSASTILDLMGFGIVIGECVMCGLDKNVKKLTNGDCDSQNPTSKKYVIGELHIKSSRYILLIT